MSNAKLDWQSVVFFLGVKVDVQRRFDSVVEGAGIDPTDLTLNQLGLANLLSVRTMNALANERIWGDKTTLRQLAKMGKKRLTQIRGLDKGCWQEICDILVAVGLNPE